MVTVRLPLFEAISGGFLVPSLEYTFELQSTDLTEQKRRQDLLAVENLASSIQF